MTRIAVLASGGGSNLQALLDAIDALGTSAPARVVLVASDRAGAGALDRARRRGIATAVLADPADGAALDALLAGHGVELVVLAGYLKLVPRQVVERFDGAIVNIHPALLPAFGGPGMYGQRVHAAVLASGARESGATVHLVSEEYDRGAILAQQRVAVEPGDTVATLSARVLAAEHELYPLTILQLAARLSARAQ
ncbi:MAG: phosphoribosylglycinamide formyltransferase [Gemmatimonadetes bacterium]|nr:phosphoribosylglycinamide formyltransferase [Gemmatimonadota bacterium]